LVVGVRWAEVEVGQNALVNEIVVTVVGRDRPGTVADVSAALAGLGLNLTDSSMTLLRGHFAMTLVCAGDATAAAVEAAIAPVCADGHLVASVRPIEPGTATGPAGVPYTVIVHGADRLGIVAATTAALARAGGNITDLSTRLAGGLYVLGAEVDLPATADIDALTGELGAVGARMAVEISLHPADADLL
jgi:glycine cleavage system transcriptional repressor